MKKLCTLGLSAILVLNSYTPIFAGSLYSDVEDSNPDLEGIAYCKEHGIMTGTNPTTFAPERALTRGEMITIIWRMQGDLNEEFFLQEPGFNDVPSWSFYKAPSTWAKMSGVLTGNLHPDGSWTFDGENTLTKEQAALILMRYAMTWKGGAAYDYTLDDPSYLAQTSPWAVQAIKWASANDLMRTENGSLDPKSPAQRGWIATFIQNFEENLGSMPTTPDTGSNPTPTPTPEPEPTPQPEPANPLNATVVSILTSCNKWMGAGAMADWQPLKLMTSMKYNPDGTFTTLHRDSSAGTGTWRVENARAIEKNVNGVIQNRYAFDLVWTDFSVDGQSYKNSVIYAELLPESRLGPNLDVSFNSCPDLGKQLSVVGALTMFGMN